jgi:hypothetical protein
MFSRFLVSCLVGFLFHIIVGDFYTIMLLCGVAGGLLPDLDVIFNHRKTLHYPNIYLMIGSFLVLLFYLTNISAILFVGIIFSSSFVHCFLDILCSGSTIKPWRESDDKAVYDHLRGKWIRPKGLFYDGSIRDMILLSISSASLYYIAEFSDILIYFILLNVILGLFYTSIRRKYPTYLENYI